MNLNIDENFDESNESNENKSNDQDENEVNTDILENLELENVLLVDPDNCGICGQPLTVARMLFCLHVFCEQCLDKKLISDDGDAGTPETAITCPICGYDSKVGIKKMGALPLDITKINTNNKLNLEKLHCTCCTAKEVAKSRCNTCHNLLCNHCDSAHHYMRCFESHKVMALDALRKNGVKVLKENSLCDLHPSENMVYYCNTCMEILCPACIEVEHVDHFCEGILDSEVKVRQEMKSLLNESETKMEELMKFSSLLDNNLQELAHQRTNARDLINESYQSYKAILEKCRGDALNKLNELYHERELMIMKENDHIGKTVGNFKDAHAYTTRFLEIANVNELMYLRKTITDRLVELNNNSPKINETFHVEFQTDLAKFEKTIYESFGQIITESNKLTSISSPFYNIPNSINATNAAASTTINTNSSSSSSFINNLNNTSLTESAITPITSSDSTNIINSSNTYNYNDSTTTTTVTSIVNDLNNQSCILTTNDSSVVVNGSSPPSMQSSFESGDITNSIQNFSLAQTPPLNNVNTSAIPAFSSIAEYNLAQLATLAETSNSPTTTSPTPQFNIADLLNSDTAYKNLASLAKLGLAGENTIQNGGIMGRPTSPTSLNISNNLINGFSGVSSSTSPLLSTPDDIIGDPLTNILPAANTNSNNSHTRSNKVSPMQIRSKFGQLGPNKGQFNSPHGFCLGLEEDIIVADTNNHRIQVFDKSGAFKFQFGTSGKDEGQLWYPRKVAVMRTTGKYVVCDRGNERSRMQIFTKNGHFLKKIAIRYIDIVAGLAVTANGEIVAVDSVSPTVFIINECGELVRWFDCSDFMREPSDIAIHGKEFYVCDFKGHNVVVFSDEGHFLRRIGCENVTNFPNGIDISDAGDILIGDSHGNRFHVAVFSRDGCLISEFECPYVKVSRCCGLKITSEGYVVTLAKNNHHVLVLNTLYIL